MGRKPNDSGPTKWAPMALLVMGLISCIVVYAFMSAALRPTGSVKIEYLESESADEGERSDGCCRGIENLELWGPAVKWGADFKLNSSEACCQACKAMCSGNSGRCLCDTWVFCGNREACGSKFGECWLKKQKDTFTPDRQEAGNKVMWTSGIIFGGGEGIVALETGHGSIRVKASFGPPYALVQGTLEAQGVTFNNIPTEFCPTISRGSVAWIGSGPEFFISLANHEEWRNTFTVFGSVLAEDMEIVEKIAQLPTKPDDWSGVSVSVLEKPVPLRIRRIKPSG